MFVVMKYPLSFIMIATLTYLVRSENLIVNGPLSDQSDHNFIATTLI